MGGIYSNQVIDKKSTVTLIASPKQLYDPALYFATYPITQKISKLVVTGDAYFSFGAHEVAGHRFLIMDDLIIDQNSLFTVKWYFNDCHFLVKKDSKHLLESIGRVRFKQHSGKGVGFKDYDADYYEIGPGLPVPESATYGAIFGTAGLGLYAWRRRAHKQRISLK